MRQPTHCSAPQRTAPHRSLARHLRGTVPPACARCDDAQCTCTIPGTPQVARSQVIEVTHPLELFRPPAHLFLNLTFGRQQPGRIAPPASGLVSFQPRPIRRQNPTAARSPRLLPENTLRGPCRADQEPGIVPIPFLGGRRSNPPLHFIIPSIVRHCSVIQTASSGSPATRDTSPGALIRPSTRTVLVHRRLSTRFWSSGLWTLLVRFSQQTLGG